MEFYKIKLQMVKEETVKYKKEDINSTSEVVKFINNIENYNLAPEENVILICLNNKNKITAYTEISKGGSNFCNIDMKVIFKTVLISNASKFILVHNHPSGDSTPSKQDYQITERIKKASELLNIEFLDHIVIGENDYKSCIY